MIRLLTALSIVLAAPVADAQTPSDNPHDRAAALYDEGRRHFDVQEYSAAIDAWKQSYLLSSEPLLLFNIGQAFRLSGDCAQANRYYLNYKEAVSDPQNRDELVAAMAKCEGVAPAVGDTKPSDVKPAPTVTPPVSPVRPTPVVAPPSAAEAAPDSSRLWRITGLAVGGAGVVALGLSTALAIHAHSVQSTIAGEPAGTPWSSVKATDDGGRSSARDAGILAVVGAVAVLGGGALWWTHRSEPSPVTVSASADHVTASVSCAF